MLAKNPFLYDIWIKKTIGAIILKQDKKIVIIPARFASTRLPGKPLIRVKNKPIIQWVYERASLSKLADEVIVATDDKNIYETVKSFGGNAVMTSDDHKSGSDRIAEIVLKDKNIDIVVNVQGDEPLIQPESIDLAINALIKDKKADISTLIRIIKDREELLNPNVVKAVIDNNGYALYFSRAPLPYERNCGESPYYAHIGLYGYRRESLLKMTEYPQSSLEKAESLEQLRALQNGLRIKTLLVDYKPVGIDTEEDLVRFKNLIS